MSATQPFALTGLASRHSARPTASMASSGVEPGDERLSEAPPPSFLEPTFGQRLLARLVDGVVALPVILLVGTMTEGHVRRTLGLTLAGTYEVALVVRRGQTLGKMAMGTRIVDRASGSLPSLWQAASRWLVIVAGSLAALVLPALDPFEIVYTVVVLGPVLRQPLHRGLHDYAAGTVVSSLRPITVRG
jgi:uncharacterized RDD family membrane protein YckC